ncbi:uncharacterized protein LOC131851886 [Achroia grisella]|uniref:uncharacterized protein LOC131851886 n=1 Tax=Achroia grisella TaxID=688607 RepID=UPI0027D2E99E|nr:uncharacterized protein LOC131851886 [Achroia grisella]
MAHLTVCVGIVLLVALNFITTDAATREARSPQFGSYANSNAQASAGAYGRPGYGGGNYQPRFIGGEYGRLRGPPPPPPRFDYGRGYGRGLGGGSGSLSISKSISISRGGVSQSSANSAAGGK